MKLIGLGANLPGPDGAPPEATLRRALGLFPGKGLTPLRGSSLWKTAPVPVSDQPWFVNAVLAVETDLSAEACLAALLDIEQRLGRVRTVRNAARVIDLDIIAWDGRVSHAPELELPHPRMDSRAFVLCPLREVAPEWTHPRLECTVSELVLRLGNLDGILKTDDKLFQDNEN